MNGMQATRKRTRITTPPPIPVDAARLDTNRRTARRRRVQMEVVIHPLLDPERRPWFSRPRRGTCRDVTDRGMLVGHTGYLPMGAVVRLFFVLPDGGAVSCYGRVVRHELWGRPRYGLKFVGISLSDALRIQLLDG